MPGQVAELTIVVKSDDVKKADARLSGMSRQSKKAQTATGKLSTSFAAAAKNLGVLVVGYIGFTTALRATNL